MKPIFLPCWIFHFRIIVYFLCDLGFRRRIQNVRSTSVVDFYESDGVFKIASVCVLPNDSWDIENESLEANWISDSTWFRRTSSVSEDINDHAGVVHVKHVPEPLYKTVRSGPQKYEVADSFRGSSELMKDLASCSSSILDPSCPERLCPIPQRSPDSVLTFQPRPIPPKIKNERKKGDQLTILIYIQIYTYPRLVLNGLRHKRLRKRMTSK